jgi:ubiquinone/menaquinone biosynthesis C-methylase UbiE
MAASKIEFSAIIAQIKNGLASAKGMKSDWNQKGTENAYGWVMTGRKDWTTDEYYATGKEHVDKYITPLFMGKNTSSMAAIDIGCGTGRMVRYMEFGRVVGTDVSASMIDKARMDNPGYEFHLTDGVSLRAISTSSIDFAFSYATLQHLTLKSYLKGTFNEIYRILKPGGTARINVRSFPGDPRGTVIWWKSFNRGFFAFTKIRGITVPYFRFYDPLFGVCVKEDELLKMVRQFSQATPWRDGPRRNLWVDLVK